MAQQVVPKQPASLMDSVRQQLRPERLIPTVTASIVIWVLCVVLAISFGALIFSGDLAMYTPIGIGLVLSSTILVNLVIPLITRFPTTVPHPQDTTAAFLAAIAASMSVAIGTSLSPENKLATIITAIAFSTLLTAITLFLLGQFRLGGLVRFIPYPVIGGFLAGTGWLVGKGAISVMSGVNLSADTIPTLLRSDILARWLPGLIFAVALIFITRRFKHYLIMPLALIVGIIIFYLVMLLLGMPVSQLSSGGWLLGPFPEGGLWHPFTALDMTRANWSFVFAQLGNMVPLVVMSVFALLLNESGLELIAERDVDLNYELKISGVANGMSALVGGMGGFATLALSALSHKIGAGNRLVGIIVAALCMVVLVFGANVLSYFPKPIVGGFLLYLALGLLVEWVIEARAKLPRNDYAIVITILLVIMFFGFLQAIVVGLVVASALFLISYSRVNVIRTATTGDRLPSNVARTLPQQRLLHEKGNQIYVLRLQGYIFFGTANTLLSQVRSRAENSQLPALRYLLFDFRLVSGMDSSALLSFLKIKQQAQLHGFKIVFTQLPASMQRQMEGDDLITKDDAVIHIFPDLDHGLEWCESQILDAEGMLDPAAPGTLPKRISETFPNVSMISYMLKYMVRREVPEDTELIVQDKVTDGLYFIESGHVTVNLITPDGKPVRLRELGSGIVVGEVAMYMGRAATASVITTEPSVVHFLSSDALIKMQTEEPAVATAFHQFMAGLLAERLVHADHRLQGLID